MADYVEDGLKKIGISISKPMLAIVCFISGVMVILLPTLLVWIVGLFLVVQGALLFTDHYEQLQRTAKPQTKSVYCQNCRVKNTEESLYCRRCGEKLVQPEQLAAAQPQEAVH